MENKENIKNTENTEITENEERTGAEPLKKKFRVSMHLIFAAAVLLVIILLLNKFIGFGRRITKEELDAIPAPDKDILETYDYIVPNLLSDDGTWPEDDGVTTVVCLGNAPFADNRDSEDNVCSLFAKKTGATVYNCAVPYSYMASCDPEFLPNVYPRDAFSFYFLTTVFTQHNDKIVEQAYKALGSRPEDTTAPVSLLQSIDFRTVDVIFIMYDGSDYLSNRKVYSDVTDDDPQYFTGALTAGIELIQKTYPWIRIIVMSPPYAFAVDENGEYVSSDWYTNSYDVPLSLYFIKEFETSYFLEITFIDNTFGGIHEDIAPDYLEDNIHLNRAGRELIAERMQEALETYASVY